MKFFRNCLLTVLGAGGLIGSAQAMNLDAVDQVVKLTQAGMTEDTIVLYIQKQNANYNLSADDIISLKQRGVSPPILNAMITSGQNAPAPAAPQPAVQPVVVAQPAAPAVAAPAPVTSPVIVAQPAFNQDVAYFYQELSPYGRWMLGEDHQWFWQPTVVVTTPTWRPYWDNGHWVYTDHGWYWSSDYSWGWAAFHYGRWHLHPHHGWVWYPDRVWGPAWVAWRSGGEYCGWAPLPRFASFDVSLGCFTYYGRRVEASFDFGLGWNHFNFCFVRELGEKPRAHFVRETEVRTVFNQTTIINNYSINRNNRDLAHPHIINAGIDPHRVSVVQKHPVETIRITDLQTPTHAKVSERIDVRAKTIEVYRPHIADAPRPQPAPVATPGRGPSAPPVAAPASPGHQSHGRGPDADGPPGQRKSR